MFQVFSCLLQHLKVLGFHAYVQLLSYQKTFVFFVFLHDLLHKMRDLLHCKLLRQQRGLSVGFFALGEGLVLFPCYYELGTA